MGNRICDLFGIELPFIGAGMIHVSTAAWAAAVSEAGGLGLLAGGSNRPDTLVDEIRKVRSLTTKPVGVNVPLLYKHAPDLLRVCADEGVKIVFTSAGNPERTTPLLHAAGIKVAHVVPSARLAKKSEQCGVDAVVAEGYEAGGHVSRDGTTTMVLVRTVKRAVNVPVICAGGIADGRQVAAAFMLGADGVQLGTRLILTSECEAHDEFKRKIREAGDGGTMVTAVRVSPSRVVHNPVSDRLRALEDGGASDDEIRDFIGRGRVRLAVVNGDVEQGSVSAGQSCYLCDEIKPVREVFADLLREMRAALDGGAWLRELTSGRS